MRILRNLLLTLAVAGLLISPAFSQANFGGKGGIGGKGGSGGGPPPPPAAPSFVDIATGDFYINAGPGTVSTSAQNVTAGNGLVVGCSANYADSQTTPSNTTATDTAGDTLARIANAGDNNSGRGIVVFYIQHSAGNAANVTVCHTTTTTGSSAAMAVQIANAGTNDAAATGTQFNVSTPFVTSSFSTVRANEIAVSFVDTGLDGTVNTFTAGSGYTIPTGGQVFDSATHYYAALEYKTFSSTQSGITAGFSFSAASASGSIAVVTF